MIATALQSYEYVVCVDTDVVFNRPAAAAYCVERFATSTDGLELLLQHNGLRDMIEVKRTAVNRGDLQQNGALTKAKANGGVDEFGFGVGFIAVRSTAATRAAFDVDASSCPEDWTDEIHLNKIATSTQIRCEALPLHLFPNGQYWAGAHHTLDAKNRMLAARPFLITYNWLDGPEKRARMELDGRWYIEAEAKEEEEAEDFVLC
mmetsp:Transcript_18110/g.36499  ORF Transcript_18110/g.36499 Transcript_18110/m.36499 type:complete len:205 (-) Transcript_18110:369-983(-)